LRSLEKQTPIGGKQAFWTALLLACAVFVPLIVWGHGCFLYMGDYNVQQIAFYKLMHASVRSGNVFWNWQTDLGAGFLPSYSFYNLCSPFFWITLPFPTAWVPYLMGPLLILKTACASFTAYLYLKRFVQRREWAVFGALLYAFSGYMLFNVFFNHFHDVCVFFPLLLVALEELVENDRRGVFALAVAANAVVNYWFFIGEVVFIVLYVAVRVLSGGWGCTVRKFLRVVLESVFGLLLAGAVFLPSVLAVMGNPRTGSSRLLTGQLMWIWGWNQRLPAILQSWFFPPEQPSNPVFFPEMGAKWSSLSAWLPLFSATGVVAYLQTHRRDFLKRMLVLSMIASVVPIFNAAFVLFNDSYYARWFYMPVLLMCAATAVALERREQPEYREAWRSGFFWVGGITLVFVLAVGFSPKRDGDELTFGLYSDAARFWFISSTALLCLVLAGIAVFRLSRHRHFHRAVFAAFSVITVIYSVAYIGSGKHSRDYDRTYLDTVVFGADKIAVETDEPFARSDLYECSDNLGLHWGLPNIQAFHSVVPVSIMEFYPSLGIKRDVSSKPGTEYRALRDLLSVRWLFIPEEEAEQEPMPDFTYFDTQNGYNIYENDRFLPMGFAFDAAISYGDAGDTLRSDRTQRYLLHALVMTEDAIDRNEDILDVEWEIENARTTASAAKKSVEERRRAGVDSFAVDRRGFTAQTSYDAPKLVFFSVPYDKGWTAEVNGELTRIERVDYGLMAVRVPAGAATVRFSYFPAGLAEGAAASAIGAILLSVYLVIAALRQGKRQPPPKGAPESNRLSESIRQMEALPPIDPEREERQ